MAEGILGLGSGQASALNSDLIEKLKTAERKSTVEPYETKLENITTEKEAFSNIETKVSELLEAIKPFDLFVSGGVSAFEQKSATTSGDSVTFDAADVKSLNKGFTSVEVTQLAQKDVYQSNTFNAATKDTAINQGDLVINGETFDTTNKTYEQLATEITAKTGMNAAVEQVGSDSYRLVIKSEETGLDNKLTISGAAADVLNFNGTDPITGTTNHILEAKNLNAKVDGVTYDVASNSITVDGLKITANKEGTSTINVVEDTTEVETQMQNFITKYNELVALVDSEAYNADSKIADKSAIRDIVNQIKTKLFGSYGENGDKSVFNFGIELAKDGGLSLDSKKFNEAVQNDIAGLKDLFLGSAENKGLGTLLKETLDEMKFSGGVLNTYESSMTSREKTLNDEKDKAEEALNKKYELLALQFSSYGAIINQMEASFSGLKMLIQQSTSGN
ncbi:MAG: flagellar filament capping protein FliD [Arcobacter sp.]|jgi:flagellar hook-associated protein 2|uniref:flagellar filament capping protein FliD n=1 Tax=Arcobacter sp. TaxID=1872629 RepID=UPI002A74B2A9|nr:flagellar filament capping protein FliD [Arcobacter sp.]MDY3203957.1 flagellar filament capping protein FliD [Arcobacter sp.]